MHSVFDDITDEELLKRSSKGDEAAFSQLSKRHRDPILHFVYGLLGNAESAEDVTQEVFLSFIRHPERFDPARTALRTYLFAAARNLAFKHLRKSGRESLFDELPEGLNIEDKLEPLRKLLNEERSSVVRNALNSLPLIYREALDLYYEDLTVAEVATIVGADVPAVKSRLHRAREQLKKLLAPYFLSETEELQGK